MLPSLLSVSHSTSCCLIMFFLLVSKTICDENTCQEPNCLSDVQSLQQLLPGSPNTTTNDETTNNSLHLSTAISISEDASEPQVSHNNYTESGVSLGQESGFWWIIMPIFLTVIPVSTILVAVVIMIRIKRQKKKSRKVILYGVPKSQDSISRASLNPKPDSISSCSVFDVIPDDDELEGMEPLSLPDF